MPGHASAASLEDRILQTLNYFEIFRYPLLPAEIHRYHPIKCTPEEVEKTLGEMVKAGTLVLSGDGFYSRSSHEEWSAERKAGHQRAMALLNRTVRFSRIISAFPFVEALAISGSLSKYYAGKDADIDYFIITTRNRLWIARSLLHLFKKLTFIPGYQHCFCMNYFVDQAALEIPDRNIYTAIELATLIPVNNTREFERLKNVNSWVADFLPNDPGLPDQRYLVKSSGEQTVRFAEKLINQLRPDRLNRFLMDFTDRKWRKKWSRKGFPMQDYDQAFLTTLHVSKNHPANYQKKVLLAMEQNNNSAGSG